MSRTIRKQILATLETLEEANEVLAKLISDRQSEEMIGLLTDCQNCAIAIGNQIDAIYPHAEKSIRALEDYCEYLYQLATCTEGTDAETACYTGIRVQTATTKEIIEKEIEDKLEIVFMPYKASMWDSLESVYLAADKDENCDAYVVPIPYFDRLANGKLGEMHYEGADYPEKIAITDWEKYSFEERCPDVIYIHNPYDEWNNVTCVHPRFFSSNLKKYTEKLVYIPYFVLEEIKPYEQNKIDNMKHFCYLPGIVNADQVILQSEDMRRIYINEYAKVLEKKGLVVDRKKLEEKFLGTGSPKFDKVLNTRKEDLEVPKEWLKIIQKPDGTWKKIIFYNTSINALLQFDEKMLVKMKSVFEIFRERQEDVALLWRPHPLIRATIESMRPQLWEKYRELVEQYKEEGWGIYDDTPDMDRAVVLCDAYYGDGSSVIPLCQKRDIPVMVQNPEATPENSRSLAMDNVVEYQGEWWFLALKDNGIYRMNPQTLEASLVVRIPWEKPETEDFPEYGPINICDGKIYILPWHATEIFVYDIKRGELHAIDFEDGYDIWGRKFWCAKRWDNKLFLFPTTYHAIICIDLDTEAVTKIMLPPIEHVESTHAWGSVYEEQNNVYLAVFDKCEIIKFDMASQSIEWISAKHLQDIAAGICGDEKGVFILPRRLDKLFYWDKEKEQLKTYSDFPEDFRYDSWAAYKVFLDERLYILPRDANMCIAVDREGNMEKFLVQEHETKTVSKIYMKYANIWKRAGVVQMVETDTGMVVSTDGMCQEIIIKDESPRFVLEIKGKLILERDNRFENLSNYIEMIVNRG